MLALVVIRDHDRHRSIAAVVVRAIGKKIVGLVLVSGCLDKVMVICGLEWTEAKTY
jgi:hypothetical protein